MSRLGNISEHEERIIRITHLAYCSNDPTVQMRAIDSLAAYGKQAISAITDVINLPSVGDQVKVYGQETIEGLKGQS